MRRFIEEMKEFFRKGDMVMLILCLITSGLGVVIIASATSADKFEGNLRYIVVQLLAIFIGVVIYAIFSSIDIYRFHYIIKFGFAQSDNQKY